jgi:hypothetical protein
MDTDALALRVQADTRHLQHQLERVERDARRLSWAAERPWSPSTHIWAEGLLPVVDLHDLSVRLAIEAVERVLDTHASLQCGAVSFITGVGRHSTGDARLPPAVGGFLAKACAAHAADGWSFRSDGPGRFVLITDPERAPAGVQSSLPQGFGWLLLALALAAVAAVVWRLILLFQ